MRCAVLLSVLSSLGLSAACGPQSVPGRTAGNTATVGADPLPAPEPAPAAAGALEFRPGPAVAWRPGPLRLTTPGRGARLAASEAASLVVTAEGVRGTLSIALDGHPFRQATGGQVPLRRLLLEDEELAPGPHRLVALDEDEAGRTVVALWFFVSEASAGPDPVEPPPGVVLVSPWGTVHGSRAADQVRVDAFTLAPGAFGSSDPAHPPVAEGARLMVALSGPVGRQQQQIRGETLEVALPSGDHQVAVTALAADERHAAGPWSTVERTITVNRDAHREEE